MGAAGNPEHGGAASSDGGEPSSVAGTPGSDGGGESSLGGAITAIGGEGGSPLFSAGQGGALVSDDVCDVAPEGTFVRFAEQPCFAVVCAAGQQVLAVDQNHEPPLSGDCVVRTCSENGDMVVTSAPLGASCDVDGGAYCDSEGNCVACLSGNDCEDNEICSQGACDVMESSCVNQHIDGDETDIDCGGSCAACDVGQDCIENADCSSQACNYYYPLRCVDNHCLDHHKDGDETDIDCGGGSCAKCPGFGWCALDSDCQSGECHTSFFYCHPDHCVNQVKDVGETGVDCGGGGGCYGCDLGSACQLDGDCLSFACDLVSMTCIADHCQDHHHDGDETDTDCGGSCAAGCTVGKKCNDASDCAPGLTCPPGIPKVCY